MSGEAYLADYVNYDFEHSPWWRPDGSSFDTEQMLKQVHSCLMQLDNTEETQVKFARREMEEEFVKQVSVDEDIVAEVELVALRNTLKWLDSQDEEQGCDRVLTVDLLTDLHSHLLCWDARRRGVLRSQTPLHEVYAICSSTGKRHVYPAAEQVHRSVQAFCDVCNLLSLHLSDKRRQFGLTVDLLDELIRFATWAYKALVSLHPFLDGNGRTSRLLLVHLLGSVFPFPVSLYLPHSKDTRRDYMRVIVDKQSDSNNNEQPVDWSLRPQPSLLATMLLESMLHSVNQFLIHQKGVSYQRTNSNSSSSSADSGFNSSDEYQRSLSGGSCSSSDADASVSSSNSDLSDAGE